AGHEWIVDVEVGDGEAGAAAEDADAGRIARPFADNDVAETIAVHVADGGVEPGPRAGVEGEEAGDDLEIDAAENDDLRPAAGAGAGDEVGRAVAVEVAGGHVDAAAERGGVGEHVADGGEVLAAEDADARPAAGAGAKADVGEAIAVELGRG